MWKDMLKGFIKDVAKEVKESYEEIKEDVKDANIGEELKNFGKEIKAEFMPEKENADTTQATAGAVTGSAISMPNANTASQPVKVEAETPKKAPEAPVGLEAADAECALNVPAEDGERGEITCLNEKTYSYLLPKDAGFVDLGDCHAAEIHQAYGFGKEINYEYDVMIYYSIAPEFDCEIKESDVKAAYTRYDSAPTRSKLMSVEHPLFTHAYLFETPKKYRITYLTQLDEYELLGCELVLRKSGGDEAWKNKMIEEFKRFAGSCREV